MTSLLSLPRISRPGLAIARSVPALLRARAGGEIRAAMTRGTLSRAALTAALAEGDAGLAALMYDHHGLGAGVQLSSSAVPQGQTLQWIAADSVMAWARSLRAAGRLDNARLATIPRDGALDRLLDVCVRASLPARDACAELPALVGMTAAARRFYAVTHSFANRVAEQCVEHRDPNEATVYLELLELPWIELPPLRGDDATALRSAVHAIGDADHIGLWVNPEHVLYALDGWFCEGLLDAASQSRKRADGSPVFTMKSCEALIEQCGLEELDQASLTQLEAHYRHLRQLEATPHWKPNSQPMRAWLKARAGGPLHSVVVRLLAIAQQLQTIDVRRLASDLEFEGDPMGVMVAEPMPDDLPHFLAGLEHYGESDIPSMWAVRRDARQNPTAFWALHDAVSMAVTLTTDAALTISAYGSLHSKAH